MAERLSVRAFSGVWLPAVLGMAILLFPFPGRPRPTLERFFHGEASRFAYSPSILRVNPGDRVTLELASSDVVHSLTYTLVMLCLLVGSR